MDSPSYPVSHGARCKFCRPLDGHMGGKPQTFPRRGTSHTPFRVSPLLSRSSHANLSLLLRYMASGSSSDPDYFQHLLPCWHNFHLHPSEGLQSSKNHSWVSTGRFLSRDSGYHLCTSADCFLLSAWPDPPWFLLKPQVVPFLFLLTLPAQVVLPLISPLVAI